MNHEKFTELEHIINETYSNITGIVIEKDGVNIYENYFNGYGPTDAVHVASVTKSLFSLLLGIAVDKGLIKSLDKKVLDFFPDFDPGYNKTARDITIKDMITMTAPYKCDVEPFIEFFASDNWLNFALNLLGGDGNIGNFRYAPIAVPHILSGIFTKATGKSLLDFAVENLFTYLEIDINNNVHVRTKEEHIAVFSDKYTKGWVVDAQGLNTPSWGLFITTRDLAKIGQLYLNNGIWKGKRIVSDEWVKTSVTEHSRWEIMDLAYGYLWWIINEKDGIFAGLGDGGNALYVNRKKNMTVAITSLMNNDVNNRIEFIEKYIETLV